MRHLTCSRCSKRLIDDFWAMVGAEPIPTFSRVTLTCECGEIISVNTGHGMKWLPHSDPPPGFEARR
jgi:RNase P subunit RPR2